MRTLFFIALSVFSFSAFSAVNDFDKVCRYFDMLDNALMQKKMSNVQKADYISALVSKELKVNSAARQAWEVIVYAVQDERYEMYKSTAKEILHTDWQCAAMKKHISTTGE